MKKTHFRVKIGVKVNFRLKIVLETINIIYPENLGFIGLFMNKRK